jgi:transcription antitermination protein NusB
MVLIPQKDFPFHLNYTRSLYSGMLNRRILRVKAFQNLYAYDQCKNSNLNIVKDQIREAFSPDLNSMEVQDKSQLKKDAEACIDLFQNNLYKDSFVAPTGTSQKIKQQALLGIRNFTSANLKDKDFLLKNMLTSAERLPELYLYAIQLLISFGEHVANDHARKVKLALAPVVINAGDLNLANNFILNKIKNAPEYRAAVTRQQAHLDELELEIKEWFRAYVKPSEAYQEYIKIDHPTTAEDFTVLDELLKKIIFKTDAIVNFFSEKDLNWTENKSIVRSLASKVLKNVADQPDKNEGILPDIAINWEEDKEFFENIFTFTIENEEINKELIAKKAQNWDIERVAHTDKIIISMAITEMKKFPSIPVKVTINEYIDISKTYSTPKSKQFVNGLLDVLSKELTDSGEIRKSGRGLLDNK